MSAFFRTKLMAAVVATMTAAGAAQAVEAPEPIDREWPHEGVFGAFDPAALQRGFQVYQGVCSGCHSMKYLAFRNLEALGYGEDEVEAIASNFMVEDGPDEYGDMFMREAKPQDHFPSPYDNDAAARAANGGALPPDLSLITKARGGGSDYIYSLLVGYEEPPEDFGLMAGMYYNEYYPGHQIAMAQPLWPDMVDYQDGTEPTVSQMAMDVTQFLNWIAEPKLEARKQTGVKVLLFLLVMSIIFYAYKRRIWADVH